MEVVTFCHTLRQNKRCLVPALYRRPAFIAGRILLALVAGIIAAAWGITLPIQGLALGAAAPRLILSLENFRLPAPGKGDSDPG